MTTRPAHPSRLIGLLAPLASAVLPGSGQLLQGRFAVGSRHASLALFLVAVGVPMSVVVTGPALFILGCWSAYDAWHGQRAAGARGSTPATGSGPLAGVGERNLAAGVTGSPSPPQAPAGPANARWRRALRVAPLLALQAVAAGEIAFLLVAAALSVMAFDAPGSTGRLDLWAFVIGMNLLPWLAALLCALAWGLHGRGRTAWAAAILSLVVLAGLAFARLLLGPQRLW